MKLHWTITKARGNLRPLLTYSIELEPWERRLATPPLRIPSSIPEPPDSWQEYCYPDQLERAGQSGPGCYALDIPPHKGGHGSTSLRLPWRADNEYPEVAASFARLRDAYEQELARAYASAPMNQSQSLRVRSPLLRETAPGILGQRILEGLHFQFEMLRISNHTACRFAEKTRFFRSLWAGRRCPPPRVSPFSKLKRSKETR